MIPYDELINELAALCGIVPEYWDIFGVRHETSIDARKAILAAMGHSVDRPEALAAEIERRRQAAWRHLVEPVLVVDAASQPLTVTAHVYLEEGEEKAVTFDCGITNEHGETESVKVSPESLTFGPTRDIDGLRHREITFVLPGIRNIGYYGLRFTYSRPRMTQYASSRLIISPGTCYLPAPTGPAPRQRHRAWGLCVNLYALQSERNWGFGDFRDLRDLAVWSAGLGAGFIGINPLHALPNRKPYGISPYSPTSRLFKNLLYIDVEAVPEILESDEARRLLASLDMRSWLLDLAEAPRIDYEGVAAAKLTVLKAAFSSFHTRHYLCGTDRGKAFIAFTQREGELLDRFALFSAICDETNTTSWEEWPEDYRLGKEKQIKDFRRFYEREILFHKYLQWIIDEQHASAARAAADGGMTVGIYHDLAVGSTGGGFDCWLMKDAVAGGMDVGAPPDDFNPKGQNWGFPPLKPEVLRKSGYDFFIQLLRHNMRHGGAVRIDHALGLFRLFWIPRGMLAMEGAYVEYPVEDLLRIIALESVRNRTMVIAEDLGTVTPEVHDMLRRYGLLSYKLFYFERNYPDPSFKAPEQYEPLALCAATTHDLPTLPGFWAGRDLEIKEDLHLFRSPEQQEHHMKARERDRGLLLEALKTQGLFPRRFPAEPRLFPVLDEPLCLAVYEYLGRTPSLLLGISLDDLIGVFDQQNLPGTVDEHPNWLQKFPLPLRQLMARSVFRDLSKALRSAGR